MNILDFLFRKRVDATANVAKERLQIVLAHERASRTAPDFLPVLQREILAVVSKILEVSDEMIKVHLERVGETSVLEINVELDKAKVKPRPPPPKPAKPGLARATAKGRLIEGA